MVFCNSLLWGVTWKLLYISIWHSWCHIPNAPIIISNVVLRSSILHISFINFLNIFRDAFLSIGTVTLIRRQIFSMWFFITRSGFQISLNIEIPNVDNFDILVLNLWRVILSIVFVRGVLCIIYWQVYVLGCLSYHCKYSVDTILLYPEVVLSLLSECSPHMRHDELLSHFRPLFC